MEQIFDVVIIGGGINGCGIAADATLRGLKTLLIEKDDLASKTSSSSSKLIHGGLRYLENYDFGLVKKALDERQTLLRIAPHLVHPLAFVLPYKKQLRPAWLIRIGLFLYDHLSRKNKLPRSRFIRRKSSPELFSPLENNYQKGFLFYDCATDDARLTLSNALQARHYGAEILCHSELLEGKPCANHWQLTIQTGQQEPIIVNAKVVINVAGPWVETVNSRLGLSAPYSVSLIKGSHIILPKLYEGNHAYFLQNQDKRVEFVVPYQGQTMVGTTEVELTTPSEHLQISPEEINYLLKSISSYFKQPITVEHILYSWSGIRSLIEHQGDKPQNLSREYVIHPTQNPAPSVIVYGGKITTYRQLAKETIDLLHPLFPNLPACKTAEALLPGSQTPTGFSFESYIKQFRKQYAWLEKSMLDRMLNNYGTLLEIILAQSTSINDLGQHFGHGLYQIEVDYLVQHEWASSAEDILWRRTKLGLAFDQEQIVKLCEYLSSHSVE